MQLTPIPQIDFEPLKKLVLDSVPSPITKEMYDRALTDFFDWWQDTSFFFKDAVFNILCFLTHLAFKRIQPEQYNTFVRLGIIHEKHGNCWDECVEAACHDATPIDRPADVWLASAVMPSSSSGSRFQPILERACLGPLLQLTAREEDKHVRPG